MNKFHDFVFVTDKYGKRNRSEDIIKLEYDSQKNIYFVTYKDGKTYPYKSSNIQIIKNCLKDKQSASVFEYLLQMAQFSEIINDNGQNLLVKNFEKLCFINEHSVLAKYLNPSKENLEIGYSKALIFPFGCNRSQYKAVDTAMKNQVSIIQGPPGTGKTQTILNIIANLLINNKTVLIVSNNNDATANVYEKLASEKYGMGFICATYGNRQNIENFIRNQQSFYPSYLRDWENSSIEFTSLENEDINNLGKYFDASEQISYIKANLAALDIETKYFDFVPHVIYSNRKLIRKTSVELIDLLQKIQFIYSEKEKISFFMKLKLKLFYNLGASKFWNSEPEKIIDTLKTTYYLLKKRELEDEINKNLLITEKINPSLVYDKSLKYLRSVIANKYLKNQTRHQFRDKNEIYCNPKVFANEYPVILSTTFSSRATIGQGIDFLFDYVIMDEASQVDVVTGALALSCARNAVIVGDKMQLPNVIEENKKQTVQELFDKSGLPLGYNFKNSFLASLELVLPNTPQTLLREHYRCHPKIINFCNQQFYGGKLLIMTEDKGEDDVLTAIKTIPGYFCKEHYNQRQIDIIKNEILSCYSDYEKSNLGIIAPYNNQVNAIKKSIPEVDAATVHKYQGREKDNIIISTTDNVITEFSDNSNMLNVAISRAKRKLAIVLSGNDHPEGSNLIALLKYIQYNNFKIVESKVCSIFDFFYSKEKEAKFRFLRMSNRISKFDSENAMNNLLIKIFKEDKFSRFDFVFEMPLKDIVNRNFLGELPIELAEYANKSWSHVDFIIYNRVNKEILFGIEVDGYKYHKPGSLQHERDKKKEKIFELINLPLLRISTKGSNEELIIREYLDKY